MGRTIYIILVTSQLFLVAVAAANVAPDDSHIDLYANLGLNHQKIASKFIHAFAKAFNNPRTRKTLAKDLYAKEAIMIKDDRTMEGQDAVQKFININIARKVRYGKIESLSSTSFGGAGITNRGGYVMVMAVGVKQRTSDEGQVHDARFTETFLLAPENEKKADYKILRHVFRHLRDHYEGPATWAVITNDQ